MTLLGASPRTNPDQTRQPSQSHGQTPLFAQILMSGARVSRLVASQSGNRRLSTIVEALIRDFYYLPAIMLIDLADFAHLYIVHCT